ncbi:MAG: 4'-phosphopantetheinyl transferase superfamily protein [Methyloceanibacter sp.]
MAKAARLSHLVGDLFPLAFRHDDPRFGTCVGVHLPVAPSVDPASLLGSLHPEEQAICRSMRGPRLIEWIGARHASRLARAGMPGAGSPTLSGPSGAPEVGGGVKLSISHTETLAVALASTNRGNTIGVDVEAIPLEARGEDLLAERILSLTERDDRAIETVQRLSIKEAAYKAISSLTGKHLPLCEISVQRDGDQGFSIRAPDAEMLVEAISSRIAGHYLSMAWARLQP